jgi:Lon protease-like protein
MISPFEPADKQSLLEAPNHDERRRLLVGLMTLYSSGDNADNALQ